MEDIDNLSSVKLLSVLVKVGVYVILLQTADGNVIYFLMDIGYILLFSFYIEK